MCFAFSASAAPVAKVGEAEYETLEAAIQAATPDANGVIEYQILGKAEVSASGWVQVVKAGLSSVSKVAFVGKTADAEICITKGVAILADQTYDLDISFENLKLSKLNPKWAKDYGHGTEYFTTWLRNTGAAENTVTYTNCKFPNGVCNNQYGKTIFEDCTFANATTGSYNMWVYGGAVEMSGCAFSGTRGVKVYTEGTPDTAPTVDVKATLFAGLTEKAAIVVSKAATVALKDVSVTDCARGTFQKAIEGASENVTLAANGTGLAGTFAITAEKDPASAKTEFNVSAGTFTAEVSADYCAEGFTVKATTDASGNTVYGVEAADPRTLGYATSGAAAALPAVPDMGGTVVNVTAAQAQYVLDGAYGSIDGKTINFTESVADTLVLGRASKYEGSGTLYRHGSHDGEAMSYSDFIAVKNQGCYYERTVENVTFTADEGVVVNFTAEGGAHVYGTESAPVYDYVRDTGTWIRDTNNSFYKRAILKNITFRSLTFTAKTDFNTSESLTVYDGFTFTNCTFEIGSTAAGNYALRYYNENNNGSVKNLVVENCAFRNCFQGIYTHHVKGITVKDCLFDTTGHNAIAIQSQGGKGACDHGAVVITGNTFKNIGDRIIRFNMVGAGTTITIADNTADGNSGKLLDSATGKREIVAASSLPENASEIITASNNDWGANAVVGNDEFADTRPVVAKIGETGYASLADALAAAQDGETVTLLADAAEDAVVATSVTLDLGGKTLTNAGAGKVTLTIAEGATVTVKNGSIVGGASNYAIQNNGTATFEDVTATAGNVGSSMLDNFGTLTINSGTYVGGMNTVKNEPKATLTVNGGTFENSYGENNAHTGVIYNLGHVAITGGELTQKATGPLWAGPHVVMTNWDGSDKPSVTITGGTFTSVWSSWRASILNHAGGGTAGCTTVSGGTFNKKVPEDYCAEGFIPTANDDGTFGVKEGAYVAAIGEVKYSDLQAAFDAAKKGDTVTLLADITLTEQVNIAKALDGLTLDGNNKTITCATTTDPLQSGGSALYFGNANDKLYCTGIAIKDLTMTGTARFAIFLCGGTSTTFTNVKISGKYCYAVNLYGTHGATMTDCNISNSMTGEAAAIWSNVASANPLTLNNTTVNVIAINAYTERNALEPKIYVNAGSTVGEIHTYDDGSVSGDTRLCVGASLVMPSVKVYDETNKTWFDASDEVVVDALIGGGRVTLPASLLAQVPGTTRFDRFSKLKEPDANGNLAWVNLVAGIDPAKKVTMTAPQNGKPDVIDVDLSAVGTAPEGTDVTVRYEIRAEGSEVAVASATAAEDLVISLNGKAGIGTYRAYVCLLQNGTVVARVESANALGVLQTVRAAKKTIIAVPWLSLTDGNAIAVADLVKTAGLTAGDKLHVYNKAENRYDVYELTTDKAWAPKAIYKVGADVTVETASFGTPETTTVARGSGVWLERQGTTQPIVSYGAVASSTVATTLDAGTKEKPTWHLLAVPTTTAVNLVTMFGKSGADEIIVPTDGAPMVCTVEDGVWRYDETVFETDESGKKLGGTVIRKTVSELPAGTGFWYLNGGAEKTVNW